MEYLMVVGLVFVIVVPMVYLFYSYSTEASAQVTEAKAGRVADDLVNAAEEVYYLGEPSKTTVRFDLPQQVFDIDVQNGKELVFKIGDRYKYKEIVAYSNVNIDNLLIPHDYAPGRHNVRMEAKGDHVAMYSGDYETAYRLGKIYNTFVRKIINYAEASQQDLIVMGKVLEENLEDIAYIYGEFPEEGLTATIDMTKLNGNLYFWVGGSNVAQPGIDMAQGAVSPAMGIKINSGGNIFFYYVSTTLDLLYYDSINSWELSGIAGTANTFDGETVTLGINKVDNNGVYDYVFKVITSSDPANPIEASIPVTDVLGDKNNWLIGDITSSMSSMEAQIIFPTPDQYTAYTKSAGITKPLTIPYEGEERFMEGIELNGNTITATYTDPKALPEDNPKTITFESYVPVRLPEGQTFAIPETCPAELSDCEGLYKFVFLKQEKYVEVSKSP